MKVEFKYFKTLGVFFSTDYDTALTKSWDEITKNVKTSLGIITGRNANIYQRAILVNSLIASKIWYTSHVYPLPFEHEKDINLHIFRYIWNSFGRKPLERVERNVLYKRKDEGGIGLLNIHIKAKSILASTTIKMFLNSDETSIIKYYLALRVNNIFGLNVLPTNVSYITTTYYEYAIDVIKLCIQNKDFPNINSKKIYMMLMPEIKPKVENDYPLYDWNNIWKNVNFRHINVNDRPIVFKYVHEILPNNKMLYQWRIRNNPQCEFCDVEDSNIHRFYYCCKVQECLNWMRKLISYLCSMNVDSLMKILSFDLPKVNINIKNTLCIILSNYIGCIWFNRDNLENIIHVFRARIIKDQKLNMKILGEKADKVFSSNYCKNIEFIYNI